MRNLHDNWVTVVELSRTPRNPGTLNPHSSRLPSPADTAAVRAVVSRVPPVCPDHSNDESRCIACTAPDADGLRQTWRRGLRNEKVSHCARCLTSLGRRPPTVRPSLRREKPPRSRAIAPPSSGPGRLAVAVFTSAADGAHFAAVLDRYLQCLPTLSRTGVPTVHPCSAGGGAEGLPCGFRRYLQGVVRDERQGNGSDPKGRYQRGLPGYHDPTAGIGGAAPATSALTLRLWLALFGFVICSAFAIWLYLISAPFGFVAALLVLAAVAVIDIAVILRRKRRGEPG